MISVNLYFILFVEEFNLEHNPDPFPVIQPLFEQILPSIVA